MSERSAVPEDLVEALLRLDDAKLLAIVQLVEGRPERARLEPLIAPLRGRLVRLRPPRMLSLPRVLTLPFEQLLVDDRSWRAGDQRIPRRHLGAIHGRILAGLPEEARRAWEARLKGRTSHDGHIVLAVGRELWPAAGAVLSHPGSVDREPPELRISLRLAAHLLFLGQYLVPFLWRLPPRPIASLDEELEGELRELLCRAFALGREAGCVVVELLVRLLESPALVLVPLLAAQDARKAREQAAAMVLEKAVEETRRRIERIAHEGPDDIEELAEVALTLAQQSGSAAALPKQLPFDRYQLRRLRQLLQALLEQVLARELEALLSPLLAEEGPEAMAEVERRAQAVARLRTVAPELGAAAKVTFQLNKAARRYAEEIERWIRARGHDLEGPCALVRLRIYELLFGSPEAVGLWRRLRKQTADGG